MTQCAARNLSMMMDLYELTMANGYFVDRTGRNRVVFDVFFREVPDGGGFALFAGLEQVVEYLTTLHFAPEDLAYLSSLKMFDPAFLEYLGHYRFSGDVYAFPEGTVMYPNEPILTVVAPLIDAQLVETAVLAQINHQSLIATKAQRVVRAAHGRAVADFGARRAHNMDAAVYGARAAYIGGVKSTATVLAGQLFGIPVSGTMAHSWVMYYKDEKTAFLKYAQTYPDNCQLLIDTYDVMRSGLPHAVAVAHEFLEPRGKRLRGVRIDSGDLAYLSKKVRRVLDDEGLRDCKIIASNSLDEYTINSILEQGGCFDAFGVGERLITARSAPVFGAVYKLAAVETDDGFAPRIKISEAPEKITNPGRKRVYRIYNAAGQAIADLIAQDAERLSHLESFRYVDPVKPWKNRRFCDCTAKELQQPVIKDGRRLLPSQDLTAIQNFVSAQLTQEIWPEEQRFENPHRHYIDMTPDYYAAKMDLLHESHAGID